MINTLHAPYVGQLVKLLAKEAEGWPEELAVYQGEGACQVVGTPEDGDDGLRECNFADGGTWEPYTVHGATSAEQYFNTLTGPTGMAAETVRERLLLHRAYRAAVALGLVADEAYAFAVRAWQCVADTDAAGPTDTVMADTPEGMPVVSEDGAIVGMLVVASLDGSQVAVVNAATDSVGAYATRREVWAPHLRLLP